MKRPAFMFYPGDWLRSADLRSCSVGARGLWIDMICLMHEGTPYGYLRVGGKDILPPILAKMVGATLEEVEEWLKELSLAGVLSQSQRSSCIYSRRMVRDESIRESRAKGGIKSLENPNVPRPRIPLQASLDPSPAVAFALAVASKPLTPKADGAELKPRKKLNGEASFELPADIDPGLWRDYLEMRVKIRKPATDRAKWLIVGKLSNLEGQGHDKRHVLMQSIRNCWQDVFPIREEKHK